jgi:spore protease
LLSVMANPSEWMGQPQPEREGALVMLGHHDEAERHALISGLLAQDNMYVTPKDVDAVVARLAGLIASALNIALHPGIAPHDAAKYL